MNRRDLLQSSGALWALSACRPVETLIGPPESSWFYSGMKLEGNGHGIGVTWGPESRMYPVKNLIHSVIYDPDSDTKVYLPKSGAHGYFQRKEGELRGFSPAEGKYFYGHGTFDHHRKVFYSTQSDVDADGPNEKRMHHKGFIYVHDPETFRITGQFPTGGHDPHDLRMAGRELVVCSGGADTQVTFLDPASGKVTQSFPLRDELLSVGHIEAIDATNFVAVTGAYRQHYPPGIFLLNRDTGLKKLSYPKELDGLFRVQLLSVVFFEGLIFATCPHTDSVFAWTRAGDFQGALHVKKAASLAVTKELNGVIVGSDLPTEPLRLIRHHQGQLRMSVLDWGLRSTGSHALVIQSS